MSIEPHDTEQMLERQARLEEERAQDLRVLAGELGRLSPSAVAAIRQLVLRANRIGGA